MLPEGLLAPRLPGAAQGASITVRQSCLSDDGGTRNAASLLAAAQVILSQFGSDGVTKPKQLLEFTVNLKYKSVGSQQLEADCMFCFYHIKSTGASRVVDHFLDHCLLCPRVVHEACSHLRAKTETSRRRGRKGKEEHTMLVREEQALELPYMSFSGQ